MRDIVTFFRIAADMIDVSAGSVTIAEFASAAIDSTNIAVGFVFPVINVQQSIKVRRQCKLHLPANDRVFNAAAGLPIELIGEATI